MTIGEFAQTIATIKCHAEFSVTSWFRSEERNKALGSKASKNSLHLVGLAVDVVPDSFEVDYPKIIHWAKRLGLRAVTYEDSKHIHLQVK